MDIIVLEKFMLELHPKRLASKKYRLVFCFDWRVFFVWSVRSSHQGLFLVSDVSQGSDQLVALVQTTRNTTGIGNRSQGNAGRGQL